jgi:hypothetical protein
LCRGEDVTTTDLSINVRTLQARNARQDVAIASAGSMALREEMKKAMGGCSATAPADPEFYLRLRDYLFTPLWKKVR